VSDSPGLGIILVVLIVSALYGARLAWNENDRTTAAGSTLIALALTGGLVSLLL
jgi:hypothetical protein